MSLLERVKEAGIIGAGGAGFPTHVKLGAQAEYILMNAAECEPLLRVDQQIMAIYPDEIIKGFEAAGRLVGAKEAIIGIKGKHKEVIEILKNHIEELKLADYVSVKELPDIYPAGDEQVLVYELTGRVVPEAGIPLHVGCVVINSETAYNIHLASMGQSVIEKFITVTGDVPNPVTVKVPVGVAIIDVLKLSGISNFEDYAVIDGGPMMGPVMDTLEGAITKKHKGFVILNKHHQLIRKKSVKLEQARRVNRSSCEQCRMCTDLCPRYLLGHGTQPHKMMRTLNYKLENTEAQGISMLCCQCNLCEYFSCPAGLFPKAANVIVRQKLQEQNIRYTPTQSEFTARNIREHRLVPSKRLVARLGLKSFDKAAPMTDVTLDVQEVKIATRQHVGAPATPVVQVGARVQAGQMIGAIPENSLGATIHSSISGTVTEIGSNYIVVRRD